MSFSSLRSTGLEAASFPSSCSRTGLACCAHRLGPPAPWLRVLVVVAVAGHGDWGACAAWASYNFQYHSDV